MEDHKVCFDGTVRSADDDIICFEYVTDASRVERVKLHLLEWSAEQLYATMTRAEAEEAERCVREVKRAKTYLIDLDIRATLPYNLSRYRPLHSSFANAETTSAATEAELSELVMRRVRAHPKLAYRLTLLEHFHARALRRRSFSLTAAVDAFDFFDARVHMSAVHPGEMVGSIAAQSIGEPCTQSEPSSSRRPPSPLFLASFFPILFPLSSLARYPLCLPAFFSASFVVGRIARRWCDTRRGAHHSSLIPLPPSPHPSMLLDASADVDAVSCASRRPQ